MNGRAFFLSPSLSLRMCMTMNGTLIEYRCDSFIIVLKRAEEEEEKKIPVILKAIIV